MLLTTMIQAAGAPPAAVDASNIVSLISGLTALVAIAITSLRKRQDVSVDEMKQRIKDLEGENDTLSDDVATARTIATVAQRDLFLVRQVLASAGLTDPTQSTEPSDTP